ncbi:HNH endonuclease [Mesorhizobium sp.]|uniref:HNH endonuclease n=1 Tax=Mesorhizobium sp. TaxID=1871066 RepID=UPI00121D7EEF|nr:MAG: hypothetical protein E5Y86_32435 [Mesorhizobium sp.]
MAARPLLPALTAERARALLIYNPETGALNWRVARPGTLSGALAGTRTSEGYTQVEIDYRLYKAHRVIWLIMTGKWPTHQVDHKNGVPITDGRICERRHRSRTLATAGQVSETAVAGSASRRRLVVAGKPSSVSTYKTT